MGVASTTNTEIYSGDGSTLTFSFPFYFFTKDDLYVYIYDTVAGTVARKTRGTHYVVTATANAQGLYPLGGLVDFTGLFGAPSTTQMVVISRTPLEQQNYALLTGGTISSTAIVQQFDYLTLLVQYLNDRAAAAVQLPQGFGPTTFSPLLPADLVVAQPGVAIVPVLKADRTGFDLAANWPTAAGIGGASASATAAAASAAAAAGSATSADASATTATTQASAASASATAAANSAAALSGTSTTSLAVGTGAKTFTTQSGKLFVAGQFLQIASNASALNYMHGTVTSYSGTSLVMDITDIGGSGTLADWNISVSGTQGPAGATGATGATGAAGTGVPTGGATGTVLKKNTGTDYDTGFGTVDTAGITAGAVTYAKIQNVSATDKVLGRSTAGAGSVEEIACTTAGRSLIAGASAAAQRTTLGSTTVGDAVFIAADATAARAAVGAVIGTDVQAFDAQLSSLVRQNSKSAAYTTVLADGGKHLLHPSADTTARTFTIDSNANVAYPIGTAITFVNQHSAGTITIAITSDTMRLAGAGTTGSRTLAADGIATALKITSTEWIISGTGLT